MQRVLIVGTKRSESIYQSGDNDVFLCITINSRKNDYHDDESYDVDNSIVMMMMMMMIIVTVLMIDRIE
jgi:hypothetical protein